MHRIFVEQVQPDEKIIILNDAGQLHHLRDVVRLKPGEPAEVFDSLGNEYLVLVSEIGSKNARFEIKEKKLPADLGIKITVACAIPKNVKMDDIVDKLTQLGVECIIPLETERVIVRLSKEKKMARENRIPRRNGKSGANAVNGLNYINMQSLMRK